MTDAQTPRNMSTELLRIAERARRDPQAVFNSLAHLISTDLLRREAQKLRKSAAVGIDGVSVEQYSEELESNLQKLHERMKAGRWRHKPLRTVSIPKANGKTRTIGISSTEDKVVQGALCEVLQAIYEQDFLPASYGYRPNRSAHDAIQAIHAHLGEGQQHWIVEADIESFFDSIVREMLEQMLRIRIADSVLLRLLGKCLHVGVLHQSEDTSSETGITQGSALSPLLGNIYLHYALDEWFETKVKPRLKGRATLVRYADDFVMIFEHKEEAEKVLEVLPRRMARFGLRLNEEKTRLVPFQRPGQHPPGGKGPGTFSFLGFTFLWRRAQAGFWRVSVQTMATRLRTAIKAVTEWCRNRRHDEVQEQHRGLVRRLQGHINYFGVSGNGKQLERLLRSAKYAWKKWLGRRDGRTKMSWQRMDAIFKRFPLPKPQVKINLWKATTQS